MSRISSIDRKRISLESERETALDRARSRIVWFHIGFALLYVLVAARVFDLSVFQARHPDTLDAPQHYREEVAENAPDAANRGHIYDRNGVLLATSLPMSSLYANPKLIIEEEQVAKGIARIFHEVDAASLTEKLKNKKREFIWVKRNISPDEKAKVLELGQPGLNFQEEYRRIYPQGTLGGHLLGYTDIDSNGLGGIERGLQNDLRQGSDVTLALDVRLQHILREEIKRSIESFTAKAGAGVIMDIQTGEVLAGISMPDFNPNDPGAADNNEIFNRLTLGAYELGSLFKIFSTAALLEYEHTPMSQKFDAREPLKVSGRTINDYHAEKRILSVPEVFIYSSNIGSALMGQKVGTQRLRNFYRDLGLLDPMDIEINEVARPLVPDPWREIDTLTASYGHGGTTTLMQVSAALSSLTNGGLVVRPTLVKGNQTGKEKIRIVSEDVSRQMRQLLRLVVTSGTGSNADVPGYQVGGKTGTAEKISASGGYDRKKLISSFASIFPAEDPQYAVVIMIDEPVGNKKSFGYATAGWVAAPAVARTISSMSSILNIPPAEPAAQTAGYDRFSAPLKRYITYKDGGDGR